MHEVKKKKKVNLDSIYEALIPFKNNKVKTFPDKKADRICSQQTYTVRNVKGSS